MEIGKIESKKNGRIERIEFIQLIGNTVLMQLKHKDGQFKNHYHRYKTREKAESMYEWWRPSFECGYKDEKRS